MKRVSFTFKKIPYPKTTVELAANVWFDEYDTPSEGRPIALYFHGGGYVVGSNYDIPLSHIEMLLERGFVIVSPDYRLCPTISAPEGPISDCKDCYAWVQTSLPSLLQDTTGIDIDTDKIVTMGGSCGGSLAHFMSSQPRPPAAIIDFAGMKYLNDIWYHFPSREVEGMPTFDVAFTEKVWSEVPPPIATSWPFRRDGAMDYSTPRFCWLFRMAQEGTAWSGLCPDGDTSCIDPAPGFSKPEYPPTCIVNGTADKIVDAKFAKWAHKDILAAGGECELLLADNQEHGFETEVRRGGVGFEVVERAFDFAKDHV